MRFSLADGTIIRRKISSAYYEFGGASGSAPIIYGNECDTALLEVTTLESIGLVLNPFTRTLHPMELLLAGLR